MSEEKKNNEESTETTAKAEKVFHAVERLIDSNDKLISVCKKMKRAVLIGCDEDELDDKALYMKTGQKIVGHYSDMTCLTGGVSALPAVIPGIGNLATFVGGNLLDIVLMLKYEVEMSLCLCYLAGFDISEERNRHLAYTVACVSSYDILSGKSRTADGLAIVESAFWDYSLRQLSKYIITIISKIVCLNISKGIVRAIPFVGMIVGASVNKVMTKRTGLSCQDAIWVRRPRPDKDGRVDSQVFDAEIIGESTDGKDGNKDMEEKDNG